MARCLRRRLRANKNFLKELRISEFAITMTFGRELWGGPETLRPAAKALQTAVYVVIENTMTNSLSFSAYKPKMRGSKSVKWNSAGELLISREDWKATLTAAAIENEQPLPLVLLFGREHYTSLLYTREPTRTVGTPAKSSLQHLLNTPEKTERARSDSNSSITTSVPNVDRTNRAAGQTQDVECEEDEEKKTDREDEWTNGNLSGATDDLTAAMEGHGASHKENQRLMATIDNGVTRKKELAAFVIAGVDEISRAELEALAGLDLDRADVDNWMKKYETP